jgi:hypothetical protein
MSYDAGAMKCRVRLKAENLEALWDLVDPLRFLSPQASMGNIMHLGVSSPQTQVILTQLANHSLLCSALRDAEN